MAQYNINTILSGISHSYFIGSEGSYLGASGIDPEKKINKRVSGAISPTSLKKIESSIGNILWIEPNNKNDDVYFYADDGKFGKIDTDNNIDIIEDLTGSSGNGLVYNNNYYYIAVDEDIHRYGPMDGIPSMEYNWWTRLAEESDYVIPARGDVIEVSYGGNEKVSQSIGTALPFNKIQIAVKNTGTDKTYRLKASIQGTEDDEVSPSNGTTFSGISYDVKYPDGEEIAFSNYDEELSDETEIIEFEFDDIIRPDDGFSVVIETQDPLQENQSFEVVISDMGDIYKEGMLSWNDGDWQISPSLIWDDDDTETQSASQTDVKEFTISTVGGEDVSGDFVVAFRLNPLTEADTWYCAPRVNGSILSSSDVAVEVFDNNTSMTSLYQSDGKSTIQDIDVSAISPTDTVHIKFTIRDTAELKDGDIISIYHDSVDEEDNPVDTRIRYFGRLSNQYEPLFYFIDNAAQKDMAMRISSVSLSFTPLGNTEYPKIGKYHIPNHSMMVHGDNSIYFCDNQIEGIINRIRTCDSITVKNPTEDFKIGDLIRGSSSNALAEILRIENIFDLEEDNTVELAIVNPTGEFEVDEEIFDETNPEKRATVITEIQRGKSNMNSDSKVLRLPYGNLPVAIESIGTDIAVCAIGSTGEVNQSSANLFLWDTFDISFYRMVSLPYPIVSAIKTHNGVPYLWGGDDDGYSLSYYSGTTIENVFYIDNGLLPLHGAVDAQKNRIIWGSSQEYPDERGCVWSWGFRSNLPPALHSILWTDEQVSALRVYDLKGNPIVSDSDGMHFSGGDNYNSIFQSEIISFGQAFDLGEVVIGLSDELEEGDEVDIYLRYDNDSKESLYEIRHDTYPDRMIVLEPKSEGVQNVFIEARIRCDKSIVLPIRITYNILNA